MANFSHLIYQNWLDGINLTKSEVEYQISNICYEKKSDRDDNVEHLPGFPVMAKPFYEFVKDNNRIPNQLEFYKRFKDTYQEQTENIIKKYKEPPLIGRVASRTYPSLLRELYIIISCKECKDFSTLYNVGLDTNGIDVLTFNNNSYVGNCVYQDTQNARFNLERKKESRWSYDNLQYLEWPLNYFNRKKVGNILLYSDRYIEEKINTIKNLLL